MTELTEVARYTMLMDWKIQCSKDTHFFQVGLQIHIISVKVPAGFLLQTWEANFKIYMEKQRNQKSAMH